MKIGSTVKADAGYKIDFSRIDNPVEALLIPPVDFVGSLAEIRSQGTVKIAQDSFEYDYQLKSEPNAGSGIKFKRGEENSQIDIGHGREESPLTGSFGKSPIDLKMASGAGWIKIHGSIGEVKVQEEFIMGDIFQGEPLLTAKGEIGGLDYEEEFFLAPDNSMISEGHLGDMEVSRIVSSRKGKREVQGNIGDQEFEEFIRYR